MQEVDATSHLRILQSFVQSGRWSPLGPNGYQTAIDAAIAPTALTGGFYPVAWHVLAALSLLIAGSTTTIATNALGFVVAAVLFPTSMCLLLQALEGRVGKVTFYGAALASLFAAFPWEFLAFGPLYPNLLAYALLPAVMACFILLVHSEAAGDARGRYGLLFGVGLVALVLSQPNAVFTAGVFLAPFCLWAIGRSHANAEAPAAPRSAARTWIARVVFAAAACLAWIVLYKAPFMQDVIHGYAWPASVSISEAAIQVCTTSYIQGPQWVLALLVAIGVVASLAQQRYRWVPLAFLIFAAIYVFGVATDGTLKRLLSGFWYADPFRLGANLVLAAIPLASIGLAGIDSAIRRAARKDREPRASRSLGSLAVLLVVAILAVAPSLAPAGVLGDAALRTVHNTVHDAYNPQGNLYDDDERAFVHLVQDALDEDALVYNNPDDGSVFAYGADGLRTKYRSMSYNFREDPASETDDSRTVRTRLDQISSDPSVAQAARESGANYVLLLDSNGSIDNQRHFNDWLNPQAFEGIQGITDKTPGFEIILAEGDMRLYRIAA